MVNVKVDRETPSWMEIQRLYNQVQTSVYAQEQEVQIRLCQKRSQHNSEKKKQRTKKHKVKCLQMNARLIFVRMLKRGKFGDGEKQLMIRCISHLSNMVEAVLCHELPVFIDDLTAVRRSRVNF